MRMLKRFILALLALAVLIPAAACSIELTQTSTVATQRPPTATEPATATLVPTETRIPTETPTLDPASLTTPTEELTPTATIPPFDFPLLDASILNAEILPGWESLGLTGKVTFLSLFPEGQAFVTFDFATGQLAPLFVAPPNTWVLSGSVSPDRSNILLAYAPPPPEGKTQYGYSDLWRLPAGGGEPEPLLLRNEEIEAYFGSTYSPDGQFAYYTWFVQDASVDFGFRYHINRLEVVTGTVTTVIEDGFWQSLSSDGSKIAYVTLDPNGGIDELRMANADGSDVQTMLDPAIHPTTDAPFFSPDMEFLYFSAVSEAPPALSWLDNLMGVQIASAHNVPSDWWRMNIATGEAAQITETFDQGMFGVFSPDGTKIAFISARGLWVMNPDGTDLVQILASSDFYGNLEWIP